MRNLFKSSLLGLLLGFIQNFSAQIETQVEKIGNGELNITMDKKISKNLETLECYKNLNHFTDISSANTTTNASTTNKKLTDAEICKQNPRILGYKIQIAVVKSKEDVDKIRSEFRSKFSNLKIEIDASLIPNYRILAGSYFTKESADDDLRKIKTSFEAATPVQYRIFCAEAK